MMCAAPAWELQTPEIVYTPRTSATVVGTFVRSRRSIVTFFLIEDKTPRGAAFAR